MNFPIVVLTFSLVVMAFSALIGDYLRTRLGAIHEEEREDFNLVLGATLTLLGLVIGFSFSMATSRYDQRKNTRRRKRVQSALNMFVPICCLPEMLQSCGPC